MAIFRTLFTVPNKTWTGLDFPPTYPLDLDGPWTLLTAPGFAAADSTGSGHDLGLPASLEAFIHRNWKAYSWDITGDISTSYTLSGSATTPGPVTGGTTFITEPVEAFVSHTFDGLSFNPTAPQPDFSDSTNVRQMIHWGGGGDGDYPDAPVVLLEGYYPVMEDETGSNATGVYVGTTFSIIGTLQPYLWYRDGSHYCEHDFTVRASMDFYFSEGVLVPDTWNLQEGQSVVPLGVEAFSRNTNFDRNAIGTMRILDSTGVDPDSSWGSLTLYATGASTLLADLTSHVRRNYLPIPGFD